MRAALLPTNGNPFILGYWLRNFATWRDEVDELVVLVNMRRGQPDRGYDEEAVKAVGGRMRFVADALGHGNALSRLIVSETDADLVVLCEEDAFVRHPGSVWAAFNRIAAGRTDVIGSPRGEDTRTVRWGPFDPSDVKELGRGLWPAFLFARRDDLLATKRQFGDLRWNLGEMLPGIGRPVDEAMCRYVGVGPERIHLDTFYATTWELRAKGLRTELVHHVRPWQAAAARRWLRDDPPWFHVTGSSALGHVLAGTRHEDLPDRHDWPRRVAWWQRVVDAVTDAPEREQALERFRSFRKHIDPDQVAAWDRVFDGWVTWAEA